jgi:hypothetical protein
MALIPTYGADGARRSRDYSLASLLRMEAANTAILRRGRRGNVQCAYLYEDSRVPIEARLRAGTRYSYQEQLDDGRKRWAHKRLPIIPHADANSTCDEQAPFLSVTLSCLRRDPAEVVANEERKQS